MDCYDKNGVPITMAQFTELKFEIEDYHRVGSTDIGPYWVSTVWLGFDHRFSGQGPPIIFETMVFPKAERDDPAYHGLHEFDTMRYCTEEEALAGHEEMCTLIRATMQEELDHADGGGRADLPVPAAPNGADRGGATSSDRRDAGGDVPGGSGEAARVVPPGGGATSVNRGQADEYGPGAGPEASKVVFLVAFDAQNPL